MLSVIPTATQMGKLAKREKGVFGMTETILVKLIEHNNWANLHIIGACSAGASWHKGIEKGCKGK